MRPNIFKCYLKQMTSILSRVENIPEDQANDFIKSVAKERIRYPKISSIHQKKPGLVETKLITFQELSNDIEDNILAPNGRVYKNAKKFPATIKEFIKDLLKQRKYHKNRMLVFQQQGDKENASIENAAQTRTKMDANSITAGAKNSPFNPFYDKSGFNAITATARLMIKIAFTICEQLLGGYWHWISEEEAIEFVSLNINTMPDKSKIRKLMNQYDLYQPTPKDLLDRFDFFLNLYKYGPSFLNKEAYFEFRSKFYTMGDNFIGRSKLIKTMLIDKPHISKETIAFPMPDLTLLVNSLDQDELAYLFYVGNLRQLFWSNESYFKGWLDEMVNLSDIEPNPCFNTNDIMTLNPLLIPFIATQYSDDLKGEELKDFIEEHPTNAQHMVTYLHKVNNLLKDKEELFLTFLKPPISVKKAPSKHKLWRNTTSGSDTDSVLYTLKDWAYWLNKDYYLDNKKTSGTLELITYLLSFITKKEMYTFATQLGASEEDKGLLNMKNEYEFPSFVTYYIKKHYGAPIRKQEGRILKEMKLDLKGLNLRGSFLPKSIKNELSNMLFGTMSRKSATPLIETTIKYEHEIFRNMLEGNLDFLKTLSVRTEDQYSNADITVFNQMRIWNDIFGEKYGMLQPPLKTPSVYLINITKEHIDEIARIDPKIAQRIDYYRTNKKLPSGLVINAQYGKIPPELMHILDFRKHVYTMMRPIYLTLNSFNLPVVFPNNYLLMSDYYDGLYLDIDDDLGSRSFIASDDKTVLVGSYKNPTKI